MTEREEESDAQGPFLFSHQLSRGVVYRCDVVRVEGVTHAEGVGEYARTEPEHPRLAQVVMMTRCRDQHDPPDHVETDRHNCHRAGPRPLCWGERILDRS